MTVIALTTLTSSSSIDTTITKLEALFTPTNAHFTIGTKVQDPNVIQITTQWPSIPSTSDLASSPLFQSLLDILRPYNPITIYATQDKFLNPGPVTEYVKTDFPLGVDEEKIEADFARFEAIYRTRGTMEEVGEVSLSTGWSKEYENDAGEKVKSLIVARGWREMKFFEEAVASETFKECIPILIGWGAPFELVSTLPRGAESKLMSCSGMLIQKWSAMRRRRLVEVLERSIVAV
jgi:hypothetical protein